ncbi:MAG: hypothetical protein KKB70_11575 [Proteobacteria bacterium]|nr:hypothetical protein [Pseudomonadota bacterium]MBU1610963.1 hypothetical protein [Pseudomonadota bacterium]
MRDSKYSILFMRDDTDVKRFRISPFWLRGYFIAQTVLVILAVGSLYLGITSLNENFTLTSEKKELSKRLEEAELRLSTLGNMEKILEAYDKSELQSLLASAPTDSQEQELQALDLAAIFTPMDHGLVSVDEVKASFKDSSLIVHFKLENPKVDTLLVGSADLALITTDGVMHELKAPEADLSFQIQRRKFARTTVSLPPGVNKETVFGLRISIKSSDGTVIFSETYPLYHILS